MKLIYIRQYGKIVANLEEKSSVNLKVNGAWNLYSYFLYDK